jgi:3-methylcrotonyl-CoA carboxylase beta subunit
VTAEELGGADLHCESQCHGSARALIEFWSHRACISGRTSGVTDHYAVNEEHALTIARRAVLHLNWVKKPNVSALE